ncbi:MAG: asparaginase [Rhodospirillales bacterium]|nr:asparaginase [Rhodospirillales bacterium]
MSSKPRIQVISTGGTISSAGASPTDASYTAGCVDSDGLLAAVPDIERIAELTSETLFDRQSGEFGLDDWRTLARRVQSAIDRPDVDGVVITHGTDTLEEAALLLELGCRVHKPVVLTGSMRAATALSADGPANLFQAVRVAADPQAVGRGVLVVMNDRVLQGILAIKAASLPVQAFESHPGGPIGRVTGRRLTFFSPPMVAPLSGRFFKQIQGNEKLPKVGIAYLWGGCGSDPLRACMEMGAEGVVIAAFGCGHLPAPIVELASRQVREGMPIVVSTRVLGATVLPDTHDLSSEPDVIASGFLNPQKSLHLLSLALADGLDFVGIAKLFGSFPYDPAGAYGIPPG